MSGFFDWLALVCGWKSVPGGAPPLEPAPAAAQIWQPGAASGEPFLSGTVCGETHAS